MSDSTDTNPDTINTDPEPWSWSDVDPDGTIRQHEVDLLAAQLMAAFPERSTLA